MLSKTSLVDESKSPYNGRRFSRSDLLSKSNRLARLLTSSSTSDSGMSEPNIFLSFDLSTSCTAALACAITPASSLLSSSMSSACCSFQRNTASYLSEARLVFSLIASVGSNLERKLRFERLDLVLETRRLLEICFCAAFSNNAIEASSASVIFGRLNWLGTSKLAIGVLASKI